MPVGKYSIKVEKNGKTILYCVYRNGTKVSRHPSKETAFDYAIGLMRAERLAALAQIARKRFGKRGIARLKTRLRRVRRARRKVRRVKRRMHRRKRRY